ncbi:hydantoinase B/oxoprolinase family protein [Sphingobium subterraneum]|uniref:N-methylhydantoinase B n=1 Tax=Sphingobium subterraneum TaxID=627688 RepID=A0A841J2D2_9SPHN|nr:hydantoinase B/oxoprolinase family protein [Sphingobium subterraneum]MBB6123686.1 N-methylhydantoinase B [Sphingobium subterraneum]
MTKQMNGAELALLNSAFEGVVRKMSNTLLRTGRSGVINRGKDFSCCIVTRGCELLAVADSLPIHVLSGPDMMAEAMHRFHPTLKAGDAYLNNSPYHGCSHPADHTIIVPVIDDAGVHHFSVVAKAHQADIGNSEPTTYMPAARDVYQEGALIFPAVKVQSDYEDIEDIIRMCEMRIRVPKQWRGDFLAMIGAARIGERELIELAREHGWDKLHMFERQWFDYSETRMAEAIRAMPSGKVTGTSRHDPFPGLPEDGLTVKAEVEIDATEGRIVVDLTDNADCVPSGVNLSEACARTSAMIGVFNSLDPKVPKNAGAFRRLDIRLREGCVVGKTPHPFSCSISTTNMADRVANAVQTGIATLNGPWGMAEVGAGLAPSLGVISGIDPRTKQVYVNQIMLGFSAGAATSVGDAWQTTAHLGNAGMCYIDGVELAELYQPMVLRKREFLMDTEGAGRYRGASSTVVEFGPVRGTFDVGYCSDGHENPPKGVCGGGVGGKSDQWIETRDGERKFLSPIGVNPVGRDEMLIAVSTGGGGYGSPMERDADVVAEDVREGWISSERAKSVYGVVLSADGAVDAAATAELRRL